MKPRLRILGLCVAAAVILIVISAAWTANETTAPSASQSAGAQQAQQEQTPAPQPAAPQSQTTAVPAPPPPPPPQGFGTVTSQNATPQTARQAQAPVPNPVMQYPGQWLWDPYAGVWYWQILIPPPVYYVTPYPSGYPYWWHGPYYPPGKWTFTPNPNYRNTITGMLLLPPQEPSGQFKPGQSPTFPWNQPRTGSGFPPGVGAQAPWLPREPKDKEQPSK